MLLNAAAYRFLPLDNLKELREELRELCRRLQLKGTILLAPEGLNLFVAGAEPAVRQLLARLPLEPSHIKFSYSESSPHPRMLVRLKKEIIAFGLPMSHEAPRLAPARLKQWLDEGRPVVLLDTRNDYEVRMGTFQDAIHLNLKQFRDFPEAAIERLKLLKEVPIVTFCTGGIRCEKAAPWLEDQGFQQVWQLDGGILRYFEEVGGDHYHGECFVFDRRVGVDPSLAETESEVCPFCLAPITPREQLDPCYIRGRRCPRCVKSRDELKFREQELRRLTLPLPGSIPALNRVPLNIPARCQGMTLRQALTTLFPQVEDWSNLRDPDQQEVDWERQVQAGERYFRIREAHVEPDVRAEVSLVFMDEALLVLNKPAPLPMHPCGRFERNTLRHFLELTFGPAVPHPVHRLDANTSGLVVCARTHHFAKVLHTQFRQGTVEKTYLAMVHGHPPEDCFEVDLPVAAEAGEAGLRAAGFGLEARTQFEVLQRYPDGTACLAARPLTGRTNQIRVHLWNLEYPIVGDPSYLPGLQRSARQTLTPTDPPMKLHAWNVQVNHPVSGERLFFQCSTREGFHPASSGAMSSIPAAGS